MGVAALRGTRSFLVLTLLSGAVVVPAAEPAGEPAPIRDNSFLVEEAYNQEAGVVQHISSLAGFREHRDWIYTFTQEWPLLSQKHQLSYTVPFWNPGEDSGGDTGLGDVLLNYRYQALGGGEERVAFSPRLSLWLPTGNDRRSRGSGAAGIQMNLPLSIDLSPGWVTHSNVGALFTPSSRGDLGEEADTTTYTLGQSVIWLARPLLNLVMEASWASFEEVTGPSETTRSSSFFLNPGIRWACNLTSGLQIVPGLAAPIGVGGSHGDYGLFLYLSFEHPLGADTSGRE